MGAVEATHGEDEDGPPPTSEELKAQWTKDQGIAELLAQQGYHPGHSVRVAAEAQAEASRQAFLESCPKHGVSKRMLWAEQALRRAKQAQAKMEQSINLLDMEYEQERASRVQQLTDLRARTRERERKLAELTQEAVDVYPPYEARATEGALRDALAVIEQRLGPAMRELFDQTAEGTDARGKVTGIMETITTVHSVMSDAAAGNAPAHRYDIGAEDMDDDWTDADDGWGFGEQGQWPRHWDQNCDWGEGWQTSSWRGDRAWDPTDDEPEAAMDTREVGIPRWMRADASATTAAHGPRAWKRGRRAGDDHDCGTQGRHGPSEEVPHDHEAAARLQARVRDAEVAASASAATAGGAGADGTAPAPATPHADDDQLSQRRRQVWDQAQAENVIVSYAEIAAMSGSEIEAWASENLV